MFPLDLALSYCFRIYHTNSIGERKPEKLKKQYLTYGTRKGRIFGKGRHQMPMSQLLHLNEEYQMLQVRKFNYVREGKKKNHLC